MPKLPRSTRPKASEASGQAVKKAHPPAEVLAENPAKGHPDLFRTMADSSPHVIWLLDKEGKTTSINAAGLRLLGTTHQEIVGKEVDTFFPEDLDNVRRVLKEASKGEQRGELRLRRLNGSACQVSYIVSPLLDATGRYGGIQIVLSEKSKTAQGESQPGEELYYALFDQLPHPVWLHDFSGVKAEFDKLRNAGVSDLDAYLKEHSDETVRLASLLRIVDMNRKALLYFGVSSKEELPSQTPLLRAIKSYEPFRQELVVLFNGGTTFSSEIEVRTPNGEERVVLLNLIVLPESVTTLSRVIITFTDITQQRRVQQELADIARVPEENPAPVMRTTENGILLYANPASRGLMRTMGLRVGEPVTEPLSGTVAAALAEKTNKMVSVKCGEQIFSIVVVPAPGRKHVNLYGRDVTPQVKFEESLRKREEGYRTMVAHADEPMILLELNGNITCVSPRLAQALRYAPEEMEGLYAPRLVDAADLVSIAQKFSEFRSNAPLPMSDTFRLQRRGGGSVWVTVTATVVNFGEETEKYLMKCELLEVPAANPFY